MYFHAEARVSRSIRFCRNRSRHNLVMFLNQLDALIKRCLLNPRYQRRHIYRGVFMPDKIYHLTDERNIVFVVNTSTKGEHWVAMYVNENKNLEFFDSLGRPPLCYDNFIQPFACHFIDKEIFWHTKTLQQPTSIVCGYYCLCFVLLKCRNETFDYKKTQKYMESLDDRKVVENPEFNGEEELWDKDSRSF